MARYIDADLLIATMQKRYDEIRDTYGYHDLYTSGYDDAVDAVENAPTADVVPREELAREIFEEIYSIRDKTTGGDIMRLAFFRKLEDLKKKYTEAEPPKES